MRRFGVPTQQPPRVGSPPCPWRKFSRGNAALAQPGHTLRAETTDTVQPISPHRVARTAAPEGLATILILH